MKPQCKSLKLNLRVGRPPERKTAITNRFQVEIRQMTLKTNFKHIGLTLSVFCFPIILYLGILITSYYKTDDFKWRDTASKSFVYFGIISLITIPGLLLHYNYYRHDKGKQLRFDLTYFELIAKSQVFKIYLKDIQKVERHSLLWGRRNPWNDYGYIKVFLKNGKSLIISSLITDPGSSEIYFVKNNVTVEKVEDFYTWVS